MEKDLKMEVFASVDTVKPVEFHVYELHVQKIGNTYSIIRGAAWKLRNWNQAGVFEDGNKIYATEKLQEKIPNADFTVEYEGSRELPVLENRRIYQELIKYWITQKLSQILIFGKYRKYSCKSNVTSKWIMTNQGFETFSSENREISLERKYNFWVTIMDDEKAYLRIDTSSLFSSNQTVADYLEKGLNLIGQEVKNDWAKNNQTGILTEICDLTVTDKLDFADSLKAYYIQRNEAYRVENISDDTRMVKVALQTGIELPYYPQALKPVLTRETVSRMDAAFSMRTESLVKRNIETRVLLDQDFIQDIGTIEPLDGMKFETDPCTVEKIGYKKGKVKEPLLVCGKDKALKCGEEFKVFNYGFYRKTEKEIKIGYLYPRNSYDLMKAVVNGIYTFAKLGKYHGEKDLYTMAGLLDLDVKAMVREEYELGDITDYKRAANKLQKIEGIDLVIALVPDGMEEDGPYNPFKTIWAKANIPSQMISMKTAKLFAEEAKEGNKAKNSSRYYLHNIILGILGKTGGIPWVVKDMPGNVDCFVGLDVATIAKGIHYPACSVVFDKYGRLLGFYKPAAPQQGEKITTRILQDIFDQVIFAYEDRFGEMPKNIVIHRDGFSNEDDEWYKNYFAAKGIMYNIIEVRKNISSKLIFWQNGQIENPPMGYCVYNADKGYLVTTNMKNKKGSPNPILIEKKCGNLSMADILTQVLYLSQLHVGSTQKLRLPITTGYADKICKNREFVPEGKMDDRLFFL